MIGQMETLQNQLAGFQAQLLPMERNIEAFISLNAILQPRLPLPPMGGWAIDADLGAILTGLVLQRRPSHIVEFGSGVSTLLFAYALQRCGEGKVTAIDHDRSYLAGTSELLGLHGLLEYVNLVHAPLVKQASGRLWYNQGELDRTIGLGGIDLLFVDGPPAVEDAEIRYPSLPALLSKLMPGSVVVLDDADREGEQRVIARWQREVQGLVVRKHETRKGTVILQLPE